MPPQLLTLQRARTAPCDTSSKVSHYEFDCNVPLPRGKTSPQLDGAQVGSDYPPTLLVRNTFLEFDVGRPASLEDFLEMRLVQSAPGSRVEDMGDASSNTAADMADAAKAAFAAQLPFPRPAPAPAPPAVDMAPVPAPASGAVLKLAHLLADSEVGSAAIPTVGSAGHHLGHCRPCAFMWKAPGCGNGVECPFCHICEPGEKKRRAKEKKERVKSQNAGGLRQSMMSGLRSMLLA